MLDLLCLLSSCGRISTFRSLMHTAFMLKRRNSMTLRTSSLLGALIVLAGCGGGGGGSGGGLRSVFRGALGRAVGDVFDMDVTINGTTISGTGRLTRQGSTLASGNVNGSLNGTTD